MPEKDNLPVSTPDAPDAVELISQVDDAPTGTGASGKTNQTFVQKVKSLVGDFVEYAKNSEY